MLRPARPLMLLAALALTTGCTGGGEPAASSASSPGGAGTPSRTTPPRPGSSTTTGASTAAGTTTTAGDATGCARRVLDGLTLEQRAGQLLMVGVQTGTDTTAVDRAITQHHVGNVLFLGGWEDSGQVRTVAARLQGHTSDASTGGLRLLVAADQEGGKIWQLRGESPRLPSAVEQGRADRATRIGYGRTLGRSLSALGVNLDLAPVADTVPASIGTANQPIGRWERQYGSDPDQVAPAVRDIVTGLHDGGVSATLKHFPGLGRVTGNTDFTTEGIDDEVATRRDPHLRPFAAGIDAGAEVVMMSSARYPRIDPDNQALFSPTLIGEVLREQLGFTGVVITDDVAAKALSGIPAGQRATRFVGAGGDVVLTGRPDEAAAMTQALVARAKADPAFRARLDDAAARVVTLKARRGLAGC